jgi:hypothetical protein
VDRLKLLNYEGRYCKQLGRAPVDRLSFALPAANPSLQLNEFLGLCSWLIKEVHSVLDDKRMLFTYECQPDTQACASVFVLTCMLMGYECARVLQFAMHCW